MMCKGVESLWAARKEYAEGAISKKVIFTKVGEDLVKIVAD